MKVRLILTVILSFFLMACDKEVASNDAEKTMKNEVLIGEVFYRERKLLPPGATLEVTLEDVSKMDVASTLIASTQQDLNGAPPYAFSIDYDASQIQEKMAYSLRAKIMMGDKLLMTSTQALNPFKTENKDIAIMVSMVAHSSPHTQSHAGKPDTGLAVVSVKPLADLSNTYWKLMSMNGEKVTMSEKQKREAFLQLNPNDEKIKGFAGCNQMMGTYATKGNDLSFSKLGSTRKACIEGMDTESQFMQVLTDTAYFSIHGHNMTLLNDSKKPIANFTAQYFN
jgi:putative lipoprotein